MQIHLDYYRILGIPIQANDELLLQAYHDRSLQLPRHEYSKYAIKARKQLLEEAYEVLYDAEKRQEYNRQFFITYSESYEEEVKTPSSQTTEVLVNEEVTQEDKIVTPSVSFPSLDIDENLLVGALLILHELGEYELVLKLSLPYLEGQKELEISEENTDKIQAIWNDLILIISSSYVELGKEDWRLGQYGLAFESEEKALRLLEQQNLFSEIQAEINADLCKLRPYLIVSILSDSNQDHSQRAKAIKLLKDILDKRQGIEGKGIDQTGLNLDDFLRFIQQVRVYLTTIEQEELFEKESKRPSSVASYLVVYALIARGFSERNPECIVRAKNILISLTKHQDVYLEQAICALFLGQTEEAELALSQSQEKEVIDYIKAHSQDSPDLLPGLCSYSEKWLQTELFSQFSNLNNQNSSLKEYFANKDVQNYLESLYLNLSDSFDVNSIVSEDNKFTDFSSWLYENSVEDEDDAEFPHLNDKYTGELLSSDNSQVLTLVSAQRNNDITDNEQDLVSFNSFLNSNLEEQSDSDSGFVSQKQNKNDNYKKKRISLKREIKKSSSKNNLFWLIIILLIASGFVFILYNLVLNRKSEELILSISEPIIEVNKNTVPVNPPITTKKLDKQMATEIVQSWLSAKAKATGPEHQINEFEKILSGELLSTWKTNAEYLAENNAYRRYTHSMSIISVTVDSKNSNQGFIIANIKEFSQYYYNGILNRNRSYNERLKVRYDVIKKDNKWLINQIKVIN